MYQNGGPSGNGLGPSAAPSTANVVVAAKDIALGSKITADAVQTKSVPVGDKPADSYGDTSQVIGQTVRQSVTSGQLITSVVLTGGTSIQDITVPPGYVGVSVIVDQVTGVGTLIKAGDYVDVVTGFNVFPEVTYDKATPAPTARASGKPTPSPSGSAQPSAANVTINNVDGAGYNPNSVKTVVEGLQVLGTLLPPPTGDAAASGAPGTTLIEGQHQVVILAATVQQAEAIRYAQVDSGGSIALLLRSSADCQTPDGKASSCPIIPTTGITLRGMVDNWGVLPPQVIQVLQPTPYPSPMPSRLYPSPSPNPSDLVSPSASTKP
jgi:Flp pilus assembly protein CpaB